MKTTTSALLTGFDNAWDDGGQITVRERLHDADTYGWGEVYRYDEMGRLVKMWNDVRNPQSFAATDPTGNYDDRVDWSLGKVYEREDVKTTPLGGAVATALYAVNQGYQYTNIGSSLAWDGNCQRTDWGTTGYTWTALGQMSQASVSGETARDYTYDAFGRRVKTVVGAVETEMLYHGWHMIGAFEKKVGGDEWLWQEVPMSYGEGMLEHVALDTNDMDENSETNEYLSYAVHEDWQNTVWALSNTSAVVVERYEQDDPFGKSHTLDASGNNLGNFASQVYHHKRMHGGVVEEVTGLYDFRNRWYSPESGSWLSRDPLGYVDSENLYQGIGGNTLTVRDTFGLRLLEGDSIIENGTAKPILAIHISGPDGACTVTPVQPGKTSPDGVDMDVVIGKYGNNPPSDAQPSSKPLVDITWRARDTNNGFEVARSGFLGNRIVAPRASGEKKKTSCICLRAWLDSDAAGESGMESAAEIGEEWYGNECSPPKIQVSVTPGGLPGGEKREFGPFEPNN